jgi:lysyl-tRNA synthetase class 2
MMLKRVMGKASFATLQDATGPHPDLRHARRRGRRGVRGLQALGPGRHRGAEGTLFKTRTGELSIHASRVRLLTKSLRPMPDKFHGMPTRR